MENFVFEYPTKVYFGKGSVSEHLSTALQSYGDTVMLAYGCGSIKKNGIYQEVVGILTECGKRIVEFSGIMPNPTYKKVLEGAAVARENDVSFILGVGGGSVIDCCKIIALQAVAKDDVWGTVIGKNGSLNAVPLPIGAIVTVTGTGAEMNGGAVITNEDAHIKTGIFARAPRFAFLDPEYTMSVPFMQSMSGAFDTLSHAMETYFGVPDEDNVSDDLSEAVMRSVIYNMRRLKINPTDYLARSNLAWNSAMAENGILKIGKKTAFQAHMIEHQLGAYTDCNHGQGLAVIQPVYYKHIYRYALPKFTRFAKNVWGLPRDGKTDEEYALAGVEALSAFVKECGLPTRLSFLEVKTPIDDGVLRDVAESTVLLGHAYKPLTAEDVYTILTECK